MPIGESLHREGTEPFGGHPGLTGRTAPGGDDQSDGDIEHLTQFTTEIVGRGAEIPHVERGSVHPTAADGVNRGKLAVSLHREHPQLRITAVQAVADGSLDGLRLESLHLHLHVALSAANPHLTDENVLEHGFLAVIENDGVGTAGFRRGDGLLPTTVPVGLRRISFLIPGGGDFHCAVLAGFSP